MTGQTLGHYRILDKLGAGGMGEVYRAEDTTLDREVALKILPPELAGSQERLDRFQREAKTLAALDHPNIVHIHTVEEVEGVHFLTMQLVEGKPLSQLIPKGGMTLERIFDIAIPLADALATAHEKGVIHRDLKPANIMVTDEGRVKVLDFGLAKLRQEAEVPLATELPTEPLTEEGKIVGTMPYMSPEQLEGKETGARSDIFSLGVVLYEMATGQRPFSGDTSVSLISSIVKDTPEDIDQLRDDVPHHLGRIVRHCLEKDPDDRFQTAKDVRNELEDLRGELQSRKVTVSSAPEAPRLRRSRRTWIALLAVLTVMAVVSFYVGRSQPPVVGTKSGVEIRSLAVLPLQNLMKDPEQDYFVDGMTEALLSDLAKIESLRVISRQSVMQYKGSEKSLPEIARELSVDAIVEGSALLAGDRVRITAQLIEAATDRHLWSESYERPLADILSLQSEVARAIAGEIRVTLTPQEEARLASASQVDPEAHMAYLRGRFFWNKQTRGEIEKACEHFRRAIDIDPAYAPAYAGLSDAYFDLALWALPPGEADARRDARARSKAAANRAVEIDPKLSEAYASLASTRFYLDWDWPGAEITFRKAVELNPSNSLARHYYSDFLSAMGRHEEAIEEAQRAEALDPLSAFRSSAVAQVLFRARQYDRAIRQLRKALDLDPDFQLAHAILGHCYFEKGQRKEAVAAWGNLHALSGNRELAQAYAELDFEVAARKWLEQVAGPSSPIYNNPGLVAKVYGQLGDNDRAFEWFERAYAARDRQLIYLGVDPFMDPLRSDPRFQDLLRRMNFPV